MAVAYTVGDSDERPWGTWRVIDAGEDFAVKRIVVKPGCRLSLQWHEGRDEHWIVARGHARVTRDDEVLEVPTNGAMYIRARQVHRVENPGDVDLVLIEVQIGPRLDEADIVRVSDDYGRS